MDTNPGAQDTAAQRILARQRRLEAKKAGLTGPKKSSGGDGGFGILSEGDTPHNAIARIAEGVTALETKKVSSKDREANRIMAVMLEEREATCYRCRDVCRF
jgi:hypothetical protein